jgi:hypothetical protein
MRRAIGYGAMKELIVAEVESLRVNVFRGYSRMLSDLSGRAARAHNPPGVFIGFLQTRIALD